MGKNRLWKRILVYMMTFMMVFSSLPTSVFAAGEKGAKTPEAQVGPHYEVNSSGNLPDTPKLEGDTSHHYGVNESEGKAEEGASYDDVVVDKTISSTGEENKFKINLKVTTKQKIEEPDMAVAFVVDVSTSMDAYYNANKSQTRIQAAQEAMKQFVEEFGDVASGTTKREIAITKFCVDAETVTEWVDVTTEAGRQTVYDYIDTLHYGVGENSGSTAKNGGTNIEGGLLLGRNLVAKQSIEDKHVILLSDGGANSCVLDTDEKGFKAHDVEKPVYYSKEELLTRDSFEGSWYYADYHFYHDGAKKAADSIQTMDVELHTVYCGNTNDKLTVGDTAAEGLLSGGNACDYCKAANAAFAADNNSLDYLVTGFLAEISDDFVATTNSEDLLGNILKLAREIGEAWVVTDPIPMGNHIEFINFEKAGSSYVYDSSLGTISWDLKSVASNDIESTTVDGVTTYTYTVSYYVRLDNVYKDFKEGISHNTNNKTSVPYVISRTTIAGNEENVVTYAGTAYFNVPSVTGYTAELTFEKAKYGQVEEGSKETEPLAGAEFAIRHDASCGCGITLDDPNWEMTTKTNSNGDIKFTDIPSGHTYIMTEKSAPDTYQVSDGEYKFSVALGTVSEISNTLFDNNKQIVNEKISTTTINGTKTWEGGNSNSRPNVTINLYANGVPALDANGNAIKVTLSSSTGWGYEFTNLPVADENGNLIEYTIIESPVDNYYPSYTGYDVENIYSTKKNITVQKLWDDANDQDGLRPGSIEVELKASYVDRYGRTQSIDINNSFKFDPTVELNESNGWTHTFINLEETITVGSNWNQRTYPVVYDVTEKYSNNAYSTDGGYDPDTDTAIFVNRHTPETTSVSVKKIWDDANNRDKMRPEALEVTLSNGTKVTLNEENNWTATVNGLPKNSNGQEIEYTWTEATLPEGYELTGTKKEGQLTTLTNKYTPETTEATVKKVWDDANNQDGKRPPELKVTLSNGTEVTLNEANDWTATVTDLPKYANGEEIAYTWTEATLPQGYTLTNTVVNDTITTLTNSYTPEETEATVKKEWNDAENQDGKRPTELKVTLSDGTEVTLNEANDWTATVTGLPKYANGKEIAYTWTEGKMPEGYTLTDTEVNGTVTTLTNSYTPKETEATVLKVWNDDSNRDNKRPKELKVTLSDGTEVTLNEENKWTATVTGLPKYADGKEIVYTWTEDEADLPEGYTLSSVNREGTLTTLTNSYTPERTSATVTKAWNDNNNQDGKRPEEISVNLLANGVGIDKTFILNEANNWTVTVNDLLKYAGGKEIEYTWTEASVPKDYNLEGVAKDGGITTITNTHTPELTEVTIKKVWDDSRNQDGKRPASLKVTLSNGTEVTLNEANGWTATVGNLPKFADGKEIVYSWTEGDLPEGYTLTSSEVKGTVTTLTNKYDTEETSATIKKVWDDDENRDGKRPKELKVTLSDGTEVTLNDKNDWTATVEDLPKYADGKEIVYSWTEDDLPEGYELTDTTVSGTITTLTNSYTPEETSATVKKVWDDAGNQDGKRPAELKVTLNNGTEVTLNEANKWTATVGDLPKYAEGKEIKYTWTEDESGLPEGYELTDTDVTGTITTLTNSYEPKTTEATVEKVWEDSRNQDGKRPETLTVTLNNGTKDVETVTLSEENKWKATVDGLPKYANGVEIEYKWTEGEMPKGYTLTDSKVDGTVTTLTNSYSTEKTAATVHKVWDDDENRDGKRPAEIIVTLSNGQDVALNTGNNWEATVTDLPKYADGEEIVYTWTENETGLPEGYELTKTEVNGTVTTFTNSYESATTEATVKKSWDDDENRDGKRPGELKVTLSDGTEVTLNEANQWTATVEDLPKFANGVEIVYTWTEGEMPDGYMLTDTEVDGTVTTLTNSYTPEVTEATVKKVWDDDNNNDGKRPASLKVTLSNGTEVTLNAANAWTATVENLPKYADGKEINYTWTEDEEGLPAGYELTDTKTEGKITTLTNSYTPELTKASIKKIWNDFDNNDGKRPTSLTVTLYSNGTKVRDIVLDSDCDWSATVDGLPKYEGGKEIAYTWTENLKVKDYALSNYETDGTTTEITNIYPVKETVNVTIKKEWADAENQDGKRPDNLTVTLSNGTEVTLNEANGWTATVEKLPKYADGQAIEYTWTESGLPEGYELTKTDVNGTVTTLTNSYTPELTEATVKKVWNDAENQDGKRPESLTVTLSNGTEVTLNEANGWTATVEKLPKYADGKEINYTWTEGKLPEGYKLTKAEANGTITTLTNTYKPETTEATVVKVWNDAENQDGKRPAELKVTLSNGTEVTLNAENNWTATVKDLPKYANGQKITYTWTEGKLPAGYELTKTDVDGATTTLTNSYTPELTEATVTKVWDDAKNQDGKRPESLTVTLNNGTEDVATVTLSETNQWTTTVENLPKYANGQEITYTWTENQESLPAGYKLTKTEANGTITTLTNKHTPEKTEMTVKKVWDDAENQDGKRPENLIVTLNNGTEDVATVTLSETNQWTTTVEGLDKYADGKEIEYTWTEDRSGLPEGYELTETAVEGTTTTLTNSYTPEETEATIVKAWDDTDNQDGKRPRSLEVTLSNGIETVETVTLNERNQWTETIKNLPKYADGKLITYVWEEADITDYELTATSKKGTVTTLTNTYPPEIREATVVKVWDDAENQDGKRPAELTVTLSNGTEDVATVTLSERNQWTATVGNLPVYAAGEKLVYTWTESGLPEGYELTNTVVEGTITTLTNSYTPETTEMTVKKVWNDEGNQDGKRPESLLVTLNNGTKDVATVTLSERNQWTATVKNLPVYAAGEQLVYKWTEATVEGYELTSTSSEGTVTTLTNTHTPETTEMTVKKVWDDADNQDGIRPTELTVTLSNGTEVTLNEANKWTATVNDLPKYANGKEIAYTWTEVSVEGYELTGNSKEGTVTTLTNKHTPELTAATVTKVWDDADNQDGIRPPSITATLSNGTEVTLNEGNNWTATVEDLPKYKAGEEITYSWTETSVEGYELTGNSTEGTVTTLTNKHTPELTEATVKKVWNDAENQDGKRPASLTVTLKDGEETVGTVTLSEDNQWTATVDKLPKYAAGKEIVYVWSEGEIPEGYELTETSLEGTVTTLTNSYEPEVREATVTKIWDDADNQDGVRPESLTVTLSNGTEVVLDESNDWTATVENLPVYEAGKLIEYTWTEASVDEYELTGTAENGTITLLTNTHVPETTELTVYKNWKDKHDKYDTRPEEITVYLEADGEIVQTVQITEADKWRYTFSELPVYADGEEIVYTISEEPVDGYITEVKDMVITNTIDPDELDKFADTGDDSKPWAYGFAGLMAMITAAGTLFIRRRED